MLPLTASTAVTLSLAVRKTATPAYNDHKLTESKD